MSTKKMCSRVAQEWLQNAFPECRLDELECYGVKLAADGFRTRDMIAKYLTSKDSSCMPLAYQRAVWLNRPSPMGDPKQQAALIWLVRVLPDLDGRDQQRYANHLVEAGFYTDVMLKHVDAADLDFMRPGHRRIYSRPQKRGKSKQHEW